ncbi:hypothetical protein HDU76_002699, partial [Blyttiomyces sp. JEL0837]
MPDEIASLTRLLYAAQKVLVPREPWNSGSVKVDLEYLQSTTTPDISDNTRRFRTAIDYYRKWNHDRNLSNRGVFNICYVDLVLPDRYGPKTIDKVNNVDNCIFHPKASFFIETFAGDQPRLLKAEHVASFLTEAVPAEFEEFQWLLEYPISTSGETQRGNEGYARLDMGAKLAGCDKKGWVTLASFRSFPMQQIRKVILGLRDGVLPLDLEIVRSVIRMAAYQVGDWKVDKSKCAALPLWKTGMVGDNEDGLVAITDVLENLVAKGWADLKYRESQNVNVSGEERRELRGQQCIMTAYAILSFGRDWLDLADLAELLCLVAQFSNSWVFACNSSKAKQLGTLQTLVGNALAFHLQQSELYWSCDLITISRMVNAAVRMVLHHIQELDWKDESESSYYSATDENGNHYLFNVLDGALLINGYCPSGLPSSVRNSSIYTRHFRTRDFEVTKFGNIFKTNVATNGYYYHFSQLGSKRIVINEVEAESGKVYQLLIFDHEGMQMWEELPVRLRLLYSHWYCEKDGLVLFRPVDFYDKATLALGTRILVPGGDVVVTDAERGTVKVRVNSAPEATFFVSEYDLHSRLNVWMARTIATRLQLAAIFAAAGTMVPGPMGMTGSEAALQLVRQCWVNRPLTAEENGKLRNVMEFSFREPALTMVCAYLQHSADKLKFLFPDRPPHPEINQRIVPDSTSFYRVQRSKHSFFNNLRRGPTEDEHKSLIRHEINRNQQRSVPLKGDTECPEIRSCANFVRERELTLANFTSKVTKQQQEVSNFPTCVVKNSGLDRRFRKALKHSWNVYQTWEQFTV